MSCERRSLLVRLFFFFLPVFCCSFSEIYTVGLNPALHQHSGSAYSNTRADRHTHTPAHTPKIIPLMDFVIVIQSRNLRGFYLFLGMFFVVNRAYVGTKPPWNNDNKDLIRTQLTSDICSRCSLHLTASISALDILYLCSVCIISGGFLASFSARPPASHSSHIRRAICEELARYLLKYPDRKWIGP